MKTNKKTIQPPAFTYEGGPSTNTNAVTQLKRVTMTCMLFEDNFYIDGKDLATMIQETCEKVSKEKIIEIALEAHQKGLLRHLPLFLIVQALKKGARCAETIRIICNRPDQMTELLSLYWADGKKPIPNQLKKGLAMAFRRFDEYQLSKWNRSEKIKLRDVLFLCHAKPENETQDQLWKRLIDNKLATPETWETKLSAGEDKKESFADLLSRGKMGVLAIVRNLRNMLEAGVDKRLVESELMKSNRPILPFQFLTAARACPQWEDIIDKAMLKSMDGKELLDGVTVVLVDVSGSMDALLSNKGTTMRYDAACGIAVLVREICKEVEIFSFSDSLFFVPPRRGLALRDAIIGSQRHSSTALGGALNRLMKYQRPEVKVKRIIVITDEQSNDAIPKMNIEHCYIINVAPYKQGIQNNGQWHTINGFSENVIDYIREFENVLGNVSVEAREPH
jgi:60 kDa SS-A/Ro ribonucleoprotein